MQVVWDKIEYAGGEVHLPFSTQSYSYALPLLLSWNFRTSDQQLDLLLEANIEHKHAKQQTSTTKNNAPIKKGLKKENQVRF
jgi:hypothetical protein